MNEVLMGKVEINSGFGFETGRNAASDKKTVPTGSECQKIRRKLFFIWLDGVRKSCIYRSVELRKLR